MLLLPPNCARLASICKEGDRRGCSAYLRITETPFKRTVHEAGKGPVERESPGWTVEASNGVTAVMVSGEAQEPDAAFADAAVPLPSGEKVGYTHADDWAEAFKRLPKGAIAQLRPQLRNVAAVLGFRGEKSGEALGTHVVSLLTTDGISSSVVKTEAEPQKFPPVPAVLPKGKPKVVCRVNAQSLMELLAVCSQFSDTVEIEFRCDNTPMVVKADNGAQRCVGVMMPTRV